MPMLRSSAHVDVWALAWRGESHPARRAGNPAPYAHSPEAKPAHQLEAAVAGTTVAAASCTAP
jgi:hypothetical protein